MVEDQDPAPPASDFVVQVTAKQFNWQVTYPGADGKFGTADDKTLLDEMHVPVNKVVHVHLRSAGRHPQLLRAAVPHEAGRGARARDRQWFEATKTGKYELPCAELCGFGHSGMRGWIYVHTADDYKKWAAENLAGRSRPPPPRRRTRRRSRPRRPPPREGRPSDERHHGHRSRAHRAREHHELGFVRTYVFSTDHKMIARQFLFLGLLMMILGGVLALVVRWQLAWPETAVPGLGAILKDTGGHPGALAPTTWRSPCTPRS